MHRVILPAIVLSLADVASTAASAQPQKIPVRVVGAADATSKDTVSFLYGVRELSDGRLLANDAGGRRLVLLDKSLAMVRVVADSASGSSSPYGKSPTGIIPYLGDSTLLVDVSSRAFLVVAPSGAVVRVMSPPRTSNLSSLANPAFGAPRLDAKGRLIYRGALMPAFKAPEPGKPFVMPEMPDSAPILRADFDTRTADTLGWIGTPKIKTSSTALEGGGVTLRMVINPLTVIDDWAMLPDGSIAILRGRDYHIDWIGVDGSRWSSAKMPFDWRRLTDEDKVALIDSTRRSIERQVAAANAGGRGGAGAAAAAGGHSMTFLRVDTTDGGAAPRAKPAAQATMQPPDVVPPSDLPDYVPPVLRSGTMNADAEGNVWILPSTSAQSASGLLYDVINRKGELFQRVRLPAGRALAGFGAGGVVYMTVRDTSGTHIERARLQ
jgi:hypothetical protein